MFHIRIKELRKEKKYTQQEVADKLGITRPAYTAYETGKRKPDFDTLKVLASLFEVSTDYLLGKIDKKITMT
ncbi:MAG TPA: helix-turn-helix transcriptional regulator [Candidatus Tetragenococcus pullicola]|nr:helix-turn-helix transcriptional regulator [Candidatus Tetragenococcus pullicola]